MKKINVIVLSSVFVFAGFLGAFFIFKFLTTEKPQVVSLPAKQTQSEVQVQKDLKQPKLSDTATALKPGVDSALKEIAQQPLVEDEESAKAEIPTLILNGIFSSKTDNYALINNRIVREGDLILGVRVVHIYPNRVELEAGGQKITLRVK